MRALGIGLLIFNLLLTAAIGLYLAPASWSKRQEMNATVAKHYLVKTGLPLDAPKFDSNASTQPISFSTTSNHVVSSVTTELLNGYFNGTNGTPVNSQMEELERAYSAKLTDLNGKSPTDTIRELAGAFNQQGIYTPGILTAMARSYDERDKARELAKKARPGAGANELAEASKELKDIFTAHYTAVKDAKTDVEKRGRIAHFLAYLDPFADTAQKRVILVVGMAQYIKMLGEQSAAYDDFNRRVASRIQQDQNGFTQEYELLRKLAIERGQLRNLQTEVEKIAGQNQADDQSASNARTTQKTNRETELANWQKKVADQLAVNAAIEKQLQDTQRKVGLLLDEIVNKELELETAEKKSTGGR